MSLIRKLENQHKHNGTNSFKLHDTCNKIKPGNFEITTNVQLIQESNYQQTKRKRKTMMVGMTSASRDQSFCVVKTE